MPPLRHTELMRRRQRGLKRTPYSFPKILGQSSLTEENLEAEDQSRDFLCVGCWGGWRVQLESQVVVKDGFESL